MYDWTLSESTIIHISSSSPGMDPQIDPAYLSHPADTEILSKGLALVDKAVSKNPLAQKIKGRLHQISQWT